MLLEGTVFQTVGAYSGEDALRRAEEFLPGVVVLDLSMPGMTGIEVARAIRAAPWGKRTTIAVMTGWASDEQRRMAAEAGCDHYFIKPVKLPALMELLHRAAVTREPEREALHQPAPTGPSTAPSLHGY